MNKEDKPVSIEPMSFFFNKRADTYDDHMLADLRLAQFYAAVSDCFPESRKILSMLDLGCGTGLQLERLFKKMPCLCVTGIDVSEKMLEILKNRFPDANIDLICGSFLDIDFGSDRFDYVLSTYSLHHFSEEEKITLYRRARESLKEHGTYVEGDYTCMTYARQSSYILEKEQLLRENKITDGLYHIDIPFTAETQMKLLLKAGFTTVRLEYEWENRSIITAQK